MAGKRWEALVGAAVVAMGLVGFQVVVLARYPEVAWAAAWLTRVLLPLGVVIGAGLVAWALGAVLGKERFPVGIFAACGLALAMGPLLVLKEQDFRRRQAEADEMAAMRRESVKLEEERARAELERALERQRLLNEDPFRRYEKQLSAEEIDRLRRWRLDLLGEVARKAEAYQTRVEAVPKPVVERALAAASAAEVEAIVTAMREVDTALDQWAFALDSLPERATGRLAELRLTGFAATVGEAELARIVQDPELVAEGKRLAALTDWHEAVERVVELLLNTWGGWEFRDGTFSSDNERLKLELQRRLARALELERDVRALWERPTGQ